MSSLSWSYQMKFLVVTILSLFVVFTLAGGVYTGPRYGKRDPGEAISRVLQRNSGVRSIQSRSAGERRFYPGTRFGGKRTIWPPTQFITPDGTEIGGPGLPLSSIPYDCLYFKFSGVRCIRPDDPLWSSIQQQSNNAGEDDLLPGSNTGGINENGNIITGNEA